MTISERSPVLFMGSPRLETNRSGCTSRKGGGIKKVVEFGRDWDYSDHPKGICESRFLLLSPEYPYYAREPKGSQ